MPAHPSKESPPARATAAPTRSWALKALDALADRSVNQLTLAWVSIVILCGVADWAAGLIPGSGLREGGSPVPISWRGLVTALYFSFVTATSVGYGDVIPLGIVRVLAIVESTAALLLFGAVISKLVSRRQERLIEEIHLTTFEERLGRVRTNLHLVLSEVQNIASICSAPGADSARALARAESAAMVFVGELRAVHDLLYRPRQLPEESQLEGILASLAATLNEFIDVLACLPEGWRNSATFLASVRGASRLAREICGECVPQVYAPELTVWMNRIQDLARKIDTV